MEGRVNPLIVTQKPTKTLLHQDSVESSGEGPPDSPSNDPVAHSYPTIALHSLQGEVTNSETPLVKKKKKKRKSFLFLRKKKRSSTGPLQLRPSLKRSGSVESDGGSSLSEFADVLVDPSLISRKSSEGRHLSASSFTRSASDSAVNRSGLEEDVMRVEEREERGGDQSWLVHITLESGHGLAIRDRTGFSDPYVKFKCGQFKYRSSVVNRNLNPEWNEAFSFIASQLQQPLEIKVYDHDYGSLDDYMGGGCLSLEAYTHGQLHIVAIGLQDPNARESSLGFIRIFLRITPYEEEKREDPVPHSIQEWNSVVTIHLLKGNNLPAMDDNGFSDPYCKFKLGRQKRRSKVVTRSLDPNWKQQFDLRMYEGDDTTLHIEVWDRDLMQTDDFIGETCVKLDTLTQEKTHDLTLPLRGEYEDDYGTIHLLLTITGTKAREDSVSDIPTAVGIQPVWSPKTIIEKYELTRSLDLALLGDVGHVKVIIDRVEGLEKNVDAFAIAEVGNSQARTHTVYRTSSPFWGKAFHFDLKDIHTTLDVSVFSAGKNKPELIGRIKVPLMRLERGVNKGHVLKDKRCLEGVRGVLYLKCCLVYQPFRAALRTFKPREGKLMEKEAPFQRKILMHNIKRIKALVNGLSVGIAAGRHIYNWESKVHSALALLLFIVGCLVFQLWMVPLLLMSAFLVQYALVYGKGRHWDQLRARKQAISMSGSEQSLDQPPLEAEDEWSDLEDELDNASGESKGGKTSIRHKFRQIQVILLIVQNVLGEIADTGERINNLLAWKVPFLCWLCIILLFLATIITFLIPLRYLILMWGVNKLTKKLRDPNHIPHNELQDLISCSPTNHDQAQYRELSLRRPSRPVAADRRARHKTTHQSRSRSPLLRSRARSIPHVKKTQVT